MSNLTKTDTVALWHAVNWFGCVLSEWRKGGFKDDMDQAQNEAQKALHLGATRALRKVNAIRKAQAAQGDRKAAGAAGGVGP